MCKDENRRVIHAFSCSQDQTVLTDAWNDVELLVDLLVHGGGDNADPGEGVGN